MNYTIRIMQRHLKLDFTSAQLSRTIVKSDQHVVFLAYSTLIFFSFFLALNQWDKLLAFIFPM